MNLYDVEFLDRGKFKLFSNRRMGIELEGCSCYTNDPNGVIHGSRIIESNVLNLLTRKM